ncbi:hypothetical protein [Paracoccus homiensis]|nr:hypothetical protein [Paracoccus homiensis]
MTQWIPHEEAMDLMGEPYPAEWTLCITRNLRSGRIDEVHRAELTEWDFHGRKQDRRTAALLMGEDEICRQEQLVLDRFWDRPAIAAE